MFRTKQDVDRHAANVLGRIKNEKEKNSRGYQIARLYFDVGEYEIAKRYLSSFLSVRETVPQAHKLMGHIYLKTNDKEKSLECYKSLSFKRTQQKVCISSHPGSLQHLVQHNQLGGTRMKSLELDGSQKDLIIKICELCTQVAMDPERVRFWLEKAEATCPGNDVIFGLREMMAQSSGNEDFQELENLLTTEMTQRPEDVALRIKLLRLYLKSGKLGQAYNVALQTDRTMAFTDSLDWYETLMDIYFAYKAENGCHGDTGFYTQFLHTLRHVVYLRLCYREPVSCADILHQFDQMLQEGVQIPVQHEEWTAFLTEMSGHFFFFCGTLLLKRAQKGNLSWKDVIPLASVCYLLNNSIITIDSRAEWFVAAGKEKRRMYDYLLMVSNFRKSQGGHTLQALGKGDTTTWTQKLRQQYCTTHGKEKLYDTLFTQPDMRTKKDRSFLMNNRTLTESVLLFPTRSQLRIFDTGCYRLHPHSLSDLIWLALQRYSCKDKAQPYYGFDVFDTLQFSVKNMASGGAESLCQLDTDVFLCVAVRCAALRQQEMIHMGHTDPAQPDFLPLCLTRPLCTQEQADWWMAAYKFFTNSVRDNFSKMRHLLQRGIETVRLLGSHGMSVNLVVHIARSLEAKVKEMKQLGSDFALKADATEARTVFYWEQAFEMLERLQKNKVQPLPKQRLFKDDTDIELDDTTIKPLISEAQYAIGYAAMKEEKYEQAIRIFEKLNNPYASFNTAKIYKVLAEQERSRDAPVGREQHQILLTRAREAIFLTMDQLQGDKKHELNKSIEQHLDDIESQLQCATDLEEDEEEEPSQYHTPTASRMDGDSTLNRSTPKEKPKSPAAAAAAAAAAHVSFNVADSSRHVRPSPERLDAQIRSLAYSQESLVKMVLARNEELVKINSQLVEALRENREVITQLKTQLNMSQKYNFSGLSTPGPHMASPYQPAYPAPQGMAPTQFGYQMPSPAGMAGYRPQSPRPRSRTNLMGHSGFIGKPDDSNVIEGEDEDENPYFIDGEYFDESLAQAHGQYFVPDSHLVQEWPYGHRAGIEGNSTVTYAPQNRPQMPQTGYFASSLRGQALQYGGQGIASSMPGPGYFSSPHAMASSVINQTPSLVAAIIGKESPQNVGTIPGQAQAGLASPAGQVMQQYLNQAASQPQPATSLAAQMGQKPGFTPGNFGAGIKTASTPVAKTNTTVPAPSQPQPVILGQMTQATAQNLINRSTASTVSPSASTAEVVCIFQGKATYTSKIGSKQEGNVKVFYFGAEKGGRVRMETLTSNQIILNHDINTMKLMPSFTPTLVTWKRPQPDGKGEDLVNLNFDNADMATKLKTVIQKIQDAGKKGTDTSSKPAPATSSPFTLAQGSPAFKPTTPAAPAASTPTAFGQSASSAVTTVTSTSVQQGQEQDKTTPVNVSKSSFGGFTFNTTPVVKPPEEKPMTSPTVKLKESTLKVTSPSATGTTETQAKPFAGFTFTPTKPITQPTPSSSSSGVVKKGSGDGPTPTSAPAFVLGQNTNSPMPSFSNIANSSQSTSFTASGGAGFINAGKTVFSPSRVGDEEDRVEEYEPNVDFKPVIELPDLVEVKTGEEDEDKVFGERAKLFRFDADTSQWKERGIGEMKILYNKDTKRYRILMRREQVLKICANHNISKDMKLTPMTSSDRAWCWSAMDFADGEMKIEKLAVKFKTPELAAKFKESFESCQKKMDSQPQPEAIGSSEVAEKQGPSKGETKSLAAMFKPKTGSWSCPGCYCQNDGEKLRCPACNTIKPGAEDEVKKAETAKSPAGISSSGFTLGPGGFKLGDGATGGGGGFSFGKKSEGGGFSFGTASSVGGSLFSAKPSQQIPVATKDAASASKVPVIEAPRGTSKPLAEVFKPKEGTWDCSGCYCRNDAAQLKCPACQTLKPGTKPEDIKSEAESVPVKPKGFLVGTGFKLPEGSGFGFSTKPATSAAPPKENQKSESKSSSTSGSLLAEMLQAKDTPEKTATPAAAASGFTFTKSGMTFPPVADASKKEGSGGFSFGTPTGTPKKDGASSFNFGAAADSTKKESAGFQFNLGKVSTPVKAKEGEKAEGSSPFQFTFSLTPSKSPQPKTSATSPRSPDDGDYYVNKDDEDSHIYFEPIVSLPEKVDMKTGEEEEITHFEQRAKLFRFHENEWKERGLGTMKILEHKDSHRRRLLMRREQIFKVCCNHYITPELELRPMTKGDGKAWVWFAQDFAEEEAKMEHLAIKFKTKEIAEQFKKEFDAAKSGDSKQPAPDSSGGATGGAAAKQEEVEPLVTSSTSQASGDTGNPYYKDELNKLCVETILQTVSSTTTGDKGSPQYKEKLDNLEVVEKMSASHVQNTGDKGNSYYKSDLDKLSVESLMVSSSAEVMGDKGNPLYSGQLDQSVVEEPMLSTTVVQGSGDMGNPLYSAQLDQSIVAEPMLSTTVVQGTGEDGNPSYISELDRLVDESQITSTSQEGVGDKGNPYYSAQLDRSDTETQMTSLTIHGTGDKGNPYLTAQLNKSGTETQVTSTTIHGTSDIGHPYHTYGKSSVEPQLSSTVVQGTGDKGNSYYSDQLDRSSVETEMTSTNIQGTGDIGNPYYKSKLDKARVEPVLSKTVIQETGDKGNTYYTAQLDKSIVEAPISSTHVEGMGDKGNIYYTAQLDQSSFETQMTSTNIQGTGDKGNPYYTSQLEKSSVEPQLSSTVLQVTGDKGSIHYTAQLDQSSVEAPMSRTHVEEMGDKGNIHYTAQLDVSPVETQMTRTTIQGTGDKGNPYHTSQLNKSSVEAPVSSTHVQGTGEKGNIYYSAQLDQSRVEPKLYSKVVQGTGDIGSPYYASPLDKSSLEPPMSRASVQGTGDKGNIHYKSQLDAAVVEPVLHSDATEGTGDQGNPYHKSHLDTLDTEELLTLSSFELDKLMEEPRIPSSVSQVTGDHGNRYYSQELDYADDLSEVEFLFKEEATEEQKARARKYLLPENFYLYENKPPCPGCIGCEDYDPSKPFTPSKQKTRAKSETSSPDPKPSGAQTSSIETTTASGEFSLFRQSTGPSFSTLAAQGDASGFAFKKDESRPFHWTGAGRPLFGSSSPGGQKTDDDDEVAPSEDIDFKPVIDLPDLVEVKTGEEDWEVVYCQRSKLYRFVREVNQWKERAVGEMKILKQDDKYRLLMRRDQVHKVACNHLIDPSIKLEPMATSETAWCWMAQDYAENEAKIEQFALRFKTEELAKQFKQKFEECQEHLRQIEADPSKKSSTPACLSVAEQLEEAATEEADEEEEEEEEEDEDDSDEENIVIFEKRATLSCFENSEWKKLGMGNLKIMYNEDLNGNNIEMQTDDETRICNHVICREHTIMLEKKHRVCMWSPIDFSTDEPVRRNFKAVFSSVAAAEEFTKTFNEGVSLARDSELSEKISHEMDTPVVFSRGDATSLQVGRKYILQLFNMFVYIALAVTSPSTVSGLELNDSSDLNSNLPQIPAQPPGQFPSFVNQSEARSSGSSQSETRTQPGESEGSQSAASSQKGEVLLANEDFPTGTCSPELTALLDSVLEEDQKR